MLSGETESEDSRGQICLASQYSNCCSRRAGHGEPFVLLTMSPEPLGQASAGPKRNLGAAVHQREDHLELSALSSFHSWK